MTAQAAADGPLPLDTALDGLLFEPGHWFCLAASNRKVAGVTPGTLAQALDLVGRSRVATVVGRLRPEVAGIDVDAGGDLGDLVVDTLSDWCRSHGLWHLLRPSGGAPGRWHLFVVPGVHREALSDQVAAVQRELRLTDEQLGLRRQFRPLSAPHRATGAQTPPDCLEGALSGLQAALEPVPAHILATRPPPAARRPASGPTGPLTPLPRPHRDLPLPWAAYLARGRRAAAAVDRDPSTRSLLELQATTALVVAGYTEPLAWAAITSAHVGAFTKARSRGRTWWWNQWNRAVVDADTWLRGRRATAPSTAPASVATHAARAYLEGQWRSWPTRTRHVDREVLLVVLERMDRVGATSVAIPQRDLVLDCAVSSRTTVRAALTRLQATGLLTVAPTYRPGTTDTANTLHLNEQPSSAFGGAMSVIGPSRFQPPQPGAPLALRRALGLPACAVLAQLAAHDSLGGITLAAVAHQAGLLDPGQHAPTPRQLRSTRDHLRTLATHGLADVDEHGHWRATTTDPAQPPEAVQHRGAVMNDLVRDRVDQERTEFRQRFDAILRRARWGQQRQRALSRSATAARARQQAWWAHQDPHTAQQRRQARGAAFSALNPPDQAELKHRLAAARARAGEAETARYHHWLTTLDAGEFDERSAQRSVAFAHRPAHERHQLVEAWAQHRARWHLPRHRPTPTPSADRPRAGGPDAALLERKPPDIQDLVLFDDTTTPRRGPLAANPRRLSPLAGPRGRA